MNNVKLSGRLISYGTSASKCWVDINADDEVITVIVDEKTLHDIDVSHYTAVFAIEGHLESYGDYASIVIADKVEVLSNSGSVE